MPYAAESEQRGAARRAPKKTTFAGLGVAAEIVDALADHGITHPFSIQELTLPIALAGRDIIGQARTGMGKTLGFGVPVLDRVFDDADIAELDGTPRALLIAPTRELAVQVGEDIERLAVHTPVRVATVYGGRPYEEQLETLEAGADIIVGTPGRLIDLHDRGALVLDKVAILVLDEADEMLDMGFLPDIEKLWSAVGATQTMLFSATMPGPILSLARSKMNKPVHIRAESDDTSATHATTRQVAFLSHRMDKAEVIARILQSPGRERTIIFARTKRSAADLAEDLAGRGFAVGAVHGDLGQVAREKALDAFRRGDVEILVATDVAARGIDVDDVTHVINYQTPDDPMTYVHRIGRTGRAGRTGVAVTLVGYDEATKWAMINTDLDLGKPNLPEWFSTSPELQEEFGFPESATGHVGRPRKVLGARPNRPSRPAAPGKRSGRKRR